MLKAFPLVRKLPEHVPFRKTLSRSRYSSLYRCEPPKRIRVALERLMDHLGVQRRKKGSKGKFYDLSLHQRIEIYANATPELRDQLLAIKWLAIQVVTRAR